MKTKSLLTLVAVGLATAISRGAPADDVNAAAKKLADAPNYSWTTTNQNNGGGGGGRGGFGMGPVNGKTEKGGYTLTSRTGQNGELQTLRKGEQFATQNFQSGEWMSAEEMREQFANFGGGRGGGGGQGGGGRGGRGGGFGFGANAMNPAEEVMALVEAAHDLKSADGAIMGSLSSEAVAQRLTFGGRGGGGQGPQNASGTVKFWLKDGAISKYELNVKGTVQGRNGEVQIDRTTTTEIKDVGTTKVSPPEAAVKKLGA
jgi:hypothetical protein